MNYERKLNLASGESTPII